MNIEHNTVFTSKQSTGPTGVLDANGIWIASAILPGSLGDRPTDRPTDHGNSRRSAQRRRQILLLSMATTGIHQSSRLDRSDQLQQSAAIFSCKTRRVAVYVETLQYSLVERVSHRRTQQVTAVYLFTDAQAVQLLHSTIPSVTFLRLSDASVQRYLPCYTVSFQSSLLFFHFGSQRTWFSQCRSSDVSKN